MGRHMLCTNSHAVHELTFCARTHMQAAPFCVLSVPYTHRPPSSSSQTPFHIVADAARARSAAWLRLLAP